MGKELPNGWIESKLGDISKIQSGGTPSRSNKSYWGGNIPWVKISDIQNLYVNETKEFITQEGLNNSAARIFPKGTVLFTIFATIGRIGILNINATTNQAVAGITPIPLINKMYLIYTLRELANSIMGQGKGVAQKNINQTILRETKIPLPPRPEQDRIVAKVDILMAQVETMQKSLERIPQLLKDFRQQVLTQAVTGKLTEEWREGKELTDSINHKLEDITISITDGDHQAPPRVEIGIPFLVISNVSKGFFDFDGVTRFVPSNYFANLKDSRVPKTGDILYTVTGSFGIPLLVNFEKDFCFQRHIAIIRPNPNFVLSEYLLIHLKSQIAKTQVEEVATGTAQMTVPLRGLRKFCFQIHSMLEQQEIISRVASLFAKVDFIEKQYQTLKAKIDTLPQAILHKAFKGELVEQLESDEPTKDLLREIEGLKKRVN
jgi:type I restriction enzyme S subunit